MPLFEIGESELVPFRRVAAGPELYESEIEDLMWSDIEAFLGSPALPIARQPQIGGGLRPDILALDRDGRVQVIEVKRDIDRRQLAQCLEYAGWAREASLDELAGLYGDGPDAFFAAWTDFTETDVPLLVQRPPHLTLVARDIDPRTESALAYLTENDLPVTVLRVTVYEDHAGRRFVDVAADHEPNLPAIADPAAAGLRPPGSRTAPHHITFDGRRFQLSDLIEAGLLVVGTELVWERPRKGQVFRAVVTDGAALRIEDGREFSTPSGAAMAAADLDAYDGWIAWKTPDGTRLDELRERCVARAEAAVGGSGEPR